jgi:plasmid stabilization system protein ParE
VTIARLRPLAEIDLVERTRHYRTGGGTELGARFFDAALASLRAIEKMPRAGSPHAGELCDIPGLRVRRVEGFPVGWFHFVHSDHADVVRLLADAQNLPIILADLDSD